MICVTHVARAEGSRAAAAALACAGAEPDRAALLIELTDRVPRSTLVSSAAARQLEERLVAHLPDARIASRGRLCQAALPASESGVEQVGPVATVGRGVPCVLHLPPSLLQCVLEETGLTVGGVLLRADLAEDRALTALVARDLISRGLTVGVLKHPIGWVAARLALVGALPNGMSSLPSTLTSRLFIESHSCYIDRDDPTPHTARASQQQRRDHAGAGSR